MLPISKFTVGVKVGRLMMRVATHWGEVLDAFGELSDQSAQLTVPAAATPFEARYKATIPDERLSLILSASDIVLVTDTYSQDKNVNAEKFLERFSEVWHLVDRILDIGAVRRIGMVAECRASRTDPSRHLIDTLIQLPIDEVAAKFHVTFEKRHLLDDGSHPDPKTSDFTNYIYSIYDAARDEVPDENAFNVNLDVQRYFNPLHEGHVHDQVRILHRKHFEPEWRAFQKTLKERGVID